MSWSTYIFRLMWIFALAGLPMQEGLGQQANVQQNKRAASQLRLKSISSIETLLKQTRESQRQYELSKRLGELYVEHFEYQRDIEMTIYQRNHQKWTGLDTNAQKSAAEPLPNLNASKKTLTRAIGIYEALVKSFPKAAGIDVVVYELAKMLMLERPVEAVAYFASIPANYPKSELIPEAYLALGEYFFDKHEMVKSQAYYKKIVAFPKHEVFAYAIYKLAWTFYNYPATSGDEVLANKRKTVKLLQKVVSVSGKKRDDSRSVTLRDEAIRDLITVWAETEDIDEAWAYFVRIGSKDSFYIMLEKLAAAYSEQGKIEKAIAVSERILREVPMRDNAPSIRHGLVDLYDQLSSLPKVIAQAKIMKSEYLPGGNWHKAHTGKDVVLQEASKKVEFVLRRYGTLYHNTGHDKNHPKYLAAAVVFYKMYIEAFPDSKDRYELNFYLASLLHEIKQYDAAASEYIRVAKMNTVDGKHLEESAFNAVLAMQTLIEVNKFPELPPSGKVPRPIALPKAKRKYVGVIDFYNSILSHKKESLPMSLNAAKTLFAYGHYSESVGRFKNLVKASPPSKQAGESIKIVLTYFSERQDWVNTIASSEEFLSYKDVIYRDHVLDVLKNSSFKQALAWEKEEKHLEAGLAFRKFALRFEKDENAERALYNSVLNYKKAGDYPESFQSADLLLAKYPNFKHRIDVVIMIAAMNESIASYDVAADKYLSFAESWPADPRSPAALFNAAVLKRALNKLSLARDLYKKYLSVYPTSAVADGALFQIAEISAELGELDQARASYVSYAAKYNKDRSQSYLARARVAKIDAQQNQKSDVFASLRADLMRDKKTSALEARDIIAGLAFEAVEEKLAEFYDLKMAKLAEVESVASKKQQKLLALASAYEQVIAVASPTYTTAALFRIGAAHQSFAEDLYGVLLPESETAENIQIIYSSIASSAGPLKSEAARYFEAAYKNSEDNQLFSEWTRLSYAKAEELNPQRFGWFGEMYGQPEYYSFDLTYDSSLEKVLGH